jgi:hypothetical protein
LGGIFYDLGGSKQRGASRTESRSLPKQLCATRLTLQTVMPEIFNANPVVFTRAKVVKQNSSLWDGQLVSSVGVDEADTEPEPIDQEEVFSALFRFFSSANRSLTCRL